MNLEELKELEDMELEDQEDQEKRKKLVMYGKFLWRHKKPLAILVLVLAVVLLAMVLRSSRARQKEMEQQMQQQEKIIEDLIKNGPNAEEGFIKEGTPVITSQQVSTQINALKELVTKEYLYTNADRYENQNQVKIHKWDVNVPMTTKSFLLAYDGRIKAGVDLSKAQVDVDEEARTITITLPASEIVSHEIFEEDIRVFDEKDSIFNKITIENYNEFVSEQKLVMEQKAEERGLLTDADKEARSALKEFLLLMPGMDTYRLNIK